MNSVDLVDYFVQSRGTQVDKLLEGLRVDDRFIRNTANWLDNFDTYKLYSNCHNSTAGFTHKDWYEVGQASHGNDAAGYLRIILKLVSTDAIYRRVPDLINHTSKVSEYRLLQAKHGHVRLRYDIPDREVRANFTIGTECWYHLGVLSAVSKLQYEGAPFGATSHELCSMPIGHILQNCYDVRDEDISYTDEGLIVFGTLIARWVRLHALEGSSDTYTGDYDLADRSGANGLLVIRGVAFNGRESFSPGEIYDAPHCLFDIDYETPSVLRRFLSLSTLGTGYYAKQLSRTEQLYLELHASKEREHRLERVLRDLIGESVTAPSDGNGSAGGTEPTAILTRREREITECIAAGMTNADIGRTLFISTETVKRHVYNIYMKLGVKNRVQLVLKMSEVSSSKDVD